MILTRRMSSWSKRDCMFEDIFHLRMGRKAKDGDGHYVETQCFNQMEEADSSSFPSLIAVNRRRHRVLLPRVARVAHLPPTVVPIPVYLPHHRAHQHLLLVNVRSQLQLEAPRLVPSHCSPIALLLLKTLHQ